MVYCNIKEIHWGWPLAIASALLYGFVFWNSQLYGQAGLQIMFMATKDPSNPSVTRVEATFNNSTGGDMEGLNFQVAVPKYMQLQMKPPSSTAVTAGSSGSVKQLFQLANSMHGQKPIVLRVKIDYNTMGRAVSETGQVDNFPPGF
jgi:AP-1 complex subunit gamma-1